MVSSWVDQGIMNKVQANKLVFIETQDFIETSLALQNYHKASVAMDDIMVAIIRSYCRHAVMVEEQFYYQLLEEKCLKELILVSSLMKGVDDASPYYHDCYHSNRKRIN